MVAQIGAMVIWQNNVPSYVLIEFNHLSKVEVVDDEVVNIVNRLFSEPRKVIVALSKFKDRPPT